MLIVIDGKIYDASKTSMTVCLSAVERLHIATMPPDCQAFLVGPRGLSEAEIKTMHDKHHKLLLKYTDKRAKEAKRQKS